MTFVCVVDMQNASPRQSIAHAIENAHNKRTQTWMFKIHEKVFGVSRCCSVE